jgi:hypothetical protein
MPASASASNRGDGVFHLSYVFCRAWQLYSTEPVCEIGAAAVGGGADPIELMEEAGDRVGRRTRAKSGVVVPVSPVGEPRAERGPEVTAI